MAAIFNRTGLKEKNCYTIVYHLGKTELFKKEVKTRNWEKC